MSISCQVTIVAAFAVVSFPVRSAVDQVPTGTPLAVCRNSSLLVCISNTARTMLYNKATRSTPNDQLVGTPTFAAALIEASWLKQPTGGFTFPRFNRHNGQSAKARAVNKARQRSSRSSRADSATKARPEKRRKEKKRTEKRMSYTGAGPASCTHPLFAAAVSYAAAGNGPYAVAIGDLDGVNGPDLAVANFGRFPIRERDVSVLLNQGDGTFAAAVSYDAGASPFSVAIGDLDGVNGPDLAVVNINGGNVSVLLNQGDGTFAAAVAYAVGPFPRNMAIGDLDGVNGPDLAVPNVSSDDVSVLLNQGDGTFAAAAYYDGG